MRAIKTNTQSIRLALNDVVAELRKPLLDTMRIRQRLLAAAEHLSTVDAQLDVVAESSGKNLQDIVRLPDGTYVNPRSVTRIEVRTTNAAGTDWKTYVRVADGGHSTAFDGDRRDELANLLFPKQPTN